MTSPFLTSKVIAFLADATTSLYCSKKSPSKYLEIHGISLNYKDWFDFYEAQQLASVGITINRADQYIYNIKYIVCMGCYTILAEVEVYFSNMPICIDVLMYDQATVYG